MMKGLFCSLVCSCVALGGVATSPVRAEEVLALGVQGSCDGSIYEQGLFADVILRFTHRPLVAARDGTSRRAAVSSVRIKADGSASLETNSAISFVDGSAVSAADFVYSIARCGVELSGEVREPGASGIAQAGFLQAGPVQLTQASDLERIRACTLRSARAESVFEDRDGKSGAFLASGPYQLAALRSVSAALVRLESEGRGSERVTIACMDQGEQLVSAVRSGALEAAYVSGRFMDSLSANSAPIGLGQGDETIVIGRCVSLRKELYGFVSRNRTISCIEGLDPLAIIRG